MPKKIFWPIALVVMGCVILAGNLNIMAVPFLNLWPLLLIIVGLGGLLTADREEWLVEEKPKRSGTSSAKKVSARKPTKKK